MALIECPECGKEYSDTAKSCPNCGYVERKTFSKVENWKRNDGIQKLIIFLGVVGILVAIVIGYRIRVENVKMSKSARTTAKEVIKLIDKYLEDDMSGEKLRDLLKGYEDDIDNIKKQGNNDKILKQLLKKTEYDLDPWLGEDAQKVKDDKGYIQKLLEDEDVSYLSALSQEYE
mgnify:FL=1|nr:MAG TPA: zinc-ribbon domain protein [Bacteriophage sp.]